jgi:hypothetical protein
VPAAPQPGKPKAAQQPSKALSLPGGAKGAPAGGYFGPDNLSAYSEADAAAAKTADAVYNALSDEADDAEDADAETRDGEEQEEDAEASSTEAAGDYEDEAAAAVETAYGVGNDEEGEDNEAAASTVSQRAVGRPGAAARGQAAGQQDADADEAAAAALECPGGTLTDCVDVCPGSSAKIYAVCVQGCGNRCSM